MAEEYIELFIYQGANFSANIVLTNQTTNAFMNLNNVSFRGRLKKSFASSNIKANLVFTIQDSANGIVEISLPSSVTANLAQGRYVHGTKMIENGTVTTPVLGGVAFVLPDV